jgi:hypothetical protein
MIVLAAAGSSTVTTAVIAAAAVVVGALATALGSAYASSRRLLEVQMTYEQKLKDAYLGNARSYLDEVYLPLQVALTKVSKAYRIARSEIDFATGTLDAVSEGELKKACEQYLAEVDALLERAAGAFLTTALEEALAFFNQFVRDSQAATKVRRLVVVEAGLFGFAISRERYMEKQMRGTPQMLPVLVAAVPGPVRIALREKRVVQAPLTSREFEEYFVASTVRLRGLIKEVTLGAHATS